MHQGLRGRLSCTRMSAAALTRWATRNPPGTIAVLQWCSYRDPAFTRAKLVNISTIICLFKNRSHKKQQYYTLIMGG